MKSRILVACRLVILVITIELDWNQNKHLLRQFDWETVDRFVAFVASVCAFLRFDRLPGRRCLCARRCPRCLSCWRIARAHVRVSACPLRPAAAAAAAACAPVFTLHPGRPPFSCRQMALYHRAVTTGFIKLISLRQCGWQAVGRRPPPSNDYLRRIYGLSFGGCEQSQRLGTAADWLTIRARPICINSVCRRWRCPWR